MEPVHPAFPRPRLLLVDDQRLVIQGLQRLLRRQQETWEVLTEESARGAIGLLEQEDFDVLLTDLNMPGFGGADLLDWARLNRPGMVRIVLTGHQDPVLILRAIGSAHRFLSKPCDPALLFQELAGVLAFITYGRAHPDLRPALAGTLQVPGAPAFLDRFRRQAQDPSRPLWDLVREDPGMTARTLQFSSSAFFGRTCPDLDLDHAARGLAREVLEALAPEALPEAAERRVAPLRRASLAAAETARALVRAEEGPDLEQHLAYEAALLAGMGPLVLAAWAHAPAGPVPDPVDLTTRYLGLLGLPGAILDLVAHQRTPALSRTPHALALAAVHVATGEADPDQLGVIGFGDRWPAWSCLRATLED